MIKITKKINKVFEDFSPIDIMDQRKQKETNRKVIHALRVAKEAREAAEEAKKQGKEALAAELEEQAQQLEDWAEGKYDVSAETSDKDAVQGTSDAKSGSSNNSDSTSIDAENNEENKLDTPDEDNSEGETSEDDFDNEDDEEDESSKNSSNADEESEEDTFDKNTKTPGNSNKNDTSEEDESEDSENSSNTDSDDSDGEDDDSDSGEMSDDEDEDDFDDEDEDSSSTSIENPFDIDPKSAEGSEEDEDSNSNNSNQPDELERMKSILKMLRGGEKAGAKDALAKILADRKASTKTTESLQEKLNITKTIEDTDDDSFNDIINQVLDTIDSISPIQYEEPRQVRVDQIKDTVLTTKNIRDLNQEDRNNLNKEIDPAIKTREREVQRYRINNLPSTDTFKLDLYDAIRDQVDKVKKAKDSWGALNRRHQGSEILKPGTVFQGDWEDKKPLIQVYLDCSGSFDKRDIDKEIALLNVLAEFESQDEIVTQIYYFSNHLYSDYESARAEGGTSAWNQMMNQIRATNATNVLIVTDSDMDYQATTCGYYEVDGCVWYIWKGSKAANMLTHLTGKQAVKEYQISW